MHSVLHTVELSGRESFGQHTRKDMLADLTFSWCKAFSLNNAFLAVVIYNVMLCLTVNTCTSQFCFSSKLMIFLLFMLVDETIAHKTKIT